MFDLLRGPSWLDRSGTTLILLCSVVTIAMLQLGKKRFKPTGQVSLPFQPQVNTAPHCYIGGGSQGLGLALACLLASRGAHVTIVSRSQKKLDEALSKIETFRKSPTQKFASLAYDLSSVEGAESAMDAAAGPFDGKVPDHVFSCTGGAAGILGYFIELTPTQLKQSVDVNYWTAVWTARAAARRMAKQGVRGSIVLTTGRVAEDRVSSLQHQQQKSKPELTKIIEGADEGLTPEKCLEKGHVMITSDPVGHLFRNSMRGMSPVSNFILDPMFAAVAPVSVILLNQVMIAIPIWRKITERQIRSHIPQHKKEVIDQLGS
ncbi:hypothetical protein VP01_301g1 [Puccinia sorghi]|uniref:3-dehydrosphinganine reductase n=1 Tax=Puccinia sorghi TaxID=27349 RepID=A0A0L6V1Y8_9BASI|nr:hypothetical protein VP01_301g1 [Puccinia sorghi]